MVNVRSLRGKENGTERSGSDKSSDDDAEKTEIVGKERTRAYHPMRSLRLRGDSGASTSRNGRQVVARNGAGKGEQGGSGDDQEDSPMSIGSARVTRRSTRGSLGEQIKTEAQLEQERENGKEGSAVNGHEAGENVNGNGTDDEEYEEQEEDVSNGSSEEESSSDNNFSLRGYRAVSQNVRRSSRSRKPRYGAYSGSWPPWTYLESDYDRQESEQRRRAPKIDMGQRKKEVNESEDMYSRVKKRRTSFTKSEPTAGTISRRLRDRSHEKPKDEEPVSRRLRERKTINYLSKADSYNASSKPKNLEVFVMKRKRFKRRRKRSSSSSSSSSSNSDRKDSPRKKPKQRVAGPDGLAFHMSQKECSKRERMMLMEAQPIAVDPSITFDSVGGLNQFIGKLKEIVLFPLMYTEFYAKKKMKPPRGILLHGPPGTGKTLLARALANECSNINGKKISFFLRKGADLLNKWIGESERQLRVLFQQAAAHQPSIIFFDEIDGLAPVRSSKSDQVHNSIVSTLLAELDGLQDRGQVIVIGSTNRLDFVDPALRRPGRFDCELPIFLPTRDGRKDILKVHLAQWEDEVPMNIIDELADRSIGFSGADLKLLCWSSSMNSLRRIYPQIYASNKKYLLNYDSIKCEREDWEFALKTVSPSTNRSIFSKYSPAQPLPLFIQPLLEDQLTKVAAILQQVFPWNSIPVTETSRKRLVLCTKTGSLVNEFLIPAVLHLMETLPVHVVSPETLHMDAMTVESAITQICAEVGRQTAACVLYIPSIDRLAMSISESAKEVLIRMMTQSVRKPILILATIEGESRVDENDSLLEEFANSFLHLRSPSLKARRAFLQPVFAEATKVKIPTEDLRILDDLPLAPVESEVKVLSEEQLKEIEKREESVFRELRIFLREILSKLARNRKFNEFTQPVDLEEAPDYLEVISHPMDFETMMYKLNMGAYLSAGQFLVDIRLISENCLNYNPNKSDYDKGLRKRAYELIDFANTLIDKEMDSDYEEQCKEIVKKRQARQEGLQNPQNPTDQGKSPSSNVTPQETTSAKANAVSKQSKSSDTVAERTPLSSQTKVGRPTSSAKYRRKKTAWARGNVKKPVRKSSQQQVVVSASQETLSEDVEMDDEGIYPTYGDEEEDEDVLVEHSDNSYDSLFVPCTSSSNSLDPVSKANQNGELSSCEREIKYKKIMDEFLEETLSYSMKFTVVDLLDLRFNLIRLVDENQRNPYKEKLANEIKALLSLRKGGPIPGLTGLQPN